MRRVGRLAWGPLAVAMAAGPVWAGKKVPPPPLVSEHQHPSGAFTFRTPGDWRVVAASTDPGALQASGGDVLVRFLFRAQEVGYDSLHATCMLERLAGPMVTDPELKYEYDYVSALAGNRRSLDSAFKIRFDAPVQGHTEWRQRNLTIVGAGQSLCIISYAPMPLWKKSAETRALLDAVLQSVTFR